MFYYFFTTRIGSNAAQLILFAIQYIVPAAILLESTGGRGGEFDLRDIAALAVFALVYEIGYLFNDFFDSHGSKVKAMFPHSKSGAMALFAANAIGILAFGWLGGLSIAQALFLAALLVVFLMHTHLAPRQRTPTFFLLNFGKVVFVATALAAVSGVQAVPIALAIALPQTWKYWTAKTGKAFVPSNWLSMFLSLLLAFLASGALAALLACAALMGLFALSALSKVRAARLRFSTLISHAHTDLSHDATLTLADYDCIPHHIYLTDHAEDVDAESFLSLRARAAQAGDKFTVGLEFPWAREHILAVNLLAPVMHPITALPQITEVTDELIWAHPNPALRRLLRDRAYREQIKSIFKFVDSVEWSNVKMFQRRRTFGLRMMAWALLFHFVKGAKKFYIAADVHEPVDFVKAGIIVPQAAGKGSQ